MRSRNFLVSETLLLGSAFMMLAGCSRLSLVYHFADRMIVSRLDREFNLSKAQREHAREVVQLQLKRMVGEESPRFEAQTLRFLAMLRKLPAPTPSDCLSSLQEGRDFLRGLVSGLEAPITDLTLSLRPEQFAYHSKHAAEELAEQQQKLDSPKARLKEQKKRFEWWCDFIGLDLTPEQEKLLPPYFARNPYPFPLEWKNRAAFDRGLVEAAKSPATLKAFLHRFFSNPLTEYTPEYQTAMEAFRREQERFQCTLLTSLNESQKKGIEKKLRDLLEQIHSLRVKEGFEK